MNSEIAALITNGATYNQEYTNGRITKSYNDNAITYYSYNSRGNVDFLVKKTNDLEAKTFEYDYNFNGALTKITYQKNKEFEAYNQMYSYDLNSKLKMVRSDNYYSGYYNLADNHVFNTHTVYNYDVLGKLTRKELGKFDNGLPMQGLDYIYTLNGQLKSINQTDLTAENDPGGDNNDLFAMSIYYHNNDYKRYGTNFGTENQDANQYYNGNISTVKWNYRDLPNALPNFTDANSDAWMYKYEYDYKNQLISAIFGESGTQTNQTQFTPDVNNFYKIYNINYDKNGNLQSLTRNGYGTNTIMDNLSYNYIQETNKLQSISDANGFDIAIGDITSQTYTYNNIAQLTAEGSDKQYEYNALGKTKTAIVEATTINYYYDEFDNLVKKQTNDGTNTTEEYSVFDVSGNMLAEYSRENAGAINLKRQYVYGASRIATLNIATQLEQANFVNPVYEISDHTASIRATFDKDVNGNLRLLSYTDYYPFGWEMPEHQYNYDQKYKYGYQGKFAEKEATTGLNNFHLRSYDSRIGRFTTMDPANQYHSPFVGMGNNPINMIDPSGGYADVGGHGWLEDQMKNYVNNHATAIQYSTYNYDPSTWGYSSGGGGYYGTSGTSSNSGNSDFLSSGETDYDTWVDNNLIPFNVIFNSEETSEEHVECGDLIDVDEDGNWIDPDGNINNINEVGTADGGVYYMQAEARLVMPIAELGFTTSIQIGLIFDANYNVATFITPSLGISSGGGYFMGVSIGSFPWANSVYDVQGWGVSAGAVWSLPSSGFGVEGNIAISGSDYRLGGTISPWGKGLGGAGYVEGSYLFMSSPVNILNYSVTQFRDLLNTLPNSSYTNNDALQILQLMHNTINK